jgi:hypothetical protein
MSDPTWDTSKENFQPLKKGRDPRRMDEANNTRHSERALKIQDERRCVPPPRDAWCMQGRKTKNIKKSDWSIFV